MNRRNFSKLFALAGVAGFTNTNKVFANENHAPSITNHRSLWVNSLDKISRPLLTNLSENSLKKNMPFELPPNGKVENKDRTYLEAFGRLLAGIAPWIELGPDNSEEGKLRREYINLCQKSLFNICDKNSPDYIAFDGGKQQLVDSAFLAHGLMRAPKQLWISLDAKTQKNITDNLVNSRKITPHNNNWLLFSAIIEAFFAKFDLPYDRMRIDYAVNQHLQWYKGDGIYGDGNDFHWDYYNSFVIQPMLIDIIETLNSVTGNKHPETEAILKRASRYAEIQERLISPEATFPPIGRSLPYRFGAFQLLNQIILRKELPKNLSEGGTRNALSQVISKMINAPGTFDENGWLKIGFYGSQPDIAEYYLSTGSLYLCSVGLLALGLPETDSFWTADAEDWTSKKIWNGETGIMPDKALR